MTSTPEGAQAPAKGSRAGRNLPAAIGVGCSLGAVLIAVLLLVPWAWYIVVSIALAIATWEVVKRLRDGGYAVPVIPMLVGGQAIIWLSWPYGLEASFVAMAATVLVMMVWKLVGQGLSNAPENYMRDLSVAVLVLAWLPMLATFGVDMVRQDLGNMRVFTLVIVVVCSDVGGYAAGVLFGKHPMAPAISPKKSWEGLAGSAIVGTIGATACAYWLLETPHWWIGPILGPLLVVVATTGDLVESQIKRDLGIKDMGTLLPGHGGIMDRLDSLLPSAFITWVVLALLL
ncbi:phosphatidate cytidylyltransferase [Gordonia phthalatica]|uniref:Phosphatidate cytidylyltransferase n=1 Tax=Gordonia phthalatica TaxID=1136941 RepID=A0A0N7FUJ6_9ACTN|nr:phosphatidate cytidylyltransferase [Gordonia phthalatica]ALG84543.1 phosphatidate cytidylyltransferase [Gordonia phthalatica]